MSDTIKEEVCREIEKLNKHLRELTMILEDLNSSSYVRVQVATRAYFNYVSENKATTVIPNPWSNLQPCNLPLGVCP
jgi:C4-type Zn-finger protein